MRIVITCLMILTAVSDTGAAAQGSGLSFLALGTNAEALARGGAGVASARGASATYWNPAGLASGETREISVSHHAWIADIRTYALTGAFSIGEKTGLGIFAVATSSGDLEARQNPGESDGFFDAQFVSVGASVARAMGPFRAGVSVKFLSERIFTNSANGYGFDLGVQTDLMNGGIHLGASYSNLGKMGKLNAEATELPNIVRVGVEVFPFQMVTAIDGASLLSTSLIFEVSRNYVTEETQLHVGISGEVLETLTARVGYLSNDPLRKYSVGIGLEITDLVFDYSVLPFEDGFGGPAHILTLTYSW